MPTLKGWNSAPAALPVPAASLAERAHAIALCFTSLGLRVAEVAQITLDDIDWCAGILTLALSTARRMDRHPLPPHSLMRLSSRIAAEAV